MPDIHMIRVITLKIIIYIGDIYQILTLITSLDPINILGWGKYCFAILTHSLERIKGKLLICQPIFDLHSYLIYLSKEGIQLT